MPLAEHWERGESGPGPSEGLGGTLRDEEYSPSLIHETKYLQVVHASPSRLPLICGRYRLLETTTPAAGCPSASHCH